MLPADERLMLCAAATGYERPTSCPRRTRRPILGARLLNLPDPSALTPHHTCAAVAATKTNFARAVNFKTQYTIKVMTDSAKEEEVKQKLTTLTKESGVEGAERLALLFIKKHGQEARTMSMAK